MKADINDRPLRRASYAVRRPYVLAMAVSTLLSTGILYLYSTGWGVTVNLQKLEESFIMHDKAHPGSRSEELAREQRTVTPSPQSLIPQRTSVPMNDEASGFYVPPKGMIPIDWNTHVRKFNSVFVQHSSCNPNDMKWTQMECSNFRARAMKRFGVEWRNGAYWDGEKIIDNPEATMRVNSEIGS